MERNNEDQRGKKMNNTKEISEMKLAVWKGKHYQEYREILSHGAQERAERRRRGGGGKEE